MTGFGVWYAEASPILVPSSVTERPPIRIIHPPARDPITGDCLRATHDRMIISWETCAVQYSIGIHVVLNFAITESNVVGKRCLEKYQGSALPGYSRCPDVNRQSLGHMLFLLQNW